MDGPYPGTIVGTNECANEVGDRGLIPCFLHQEKGFINVYLRCHLSQQTSCSVTVPNGNDGHEICILLVSCVNLQYTCE